MVLGLWYFLIFFSIFVSGQGNLETSKASLCLGAKIPGSVRSGDFFPLKRSFGHYLFQGIGAG